MQNLSDELQSVIGGWRQTEVRRTYVYVNQRNELICTMRKVYCS